MKVEKRVNEETVFGDLLLGDVFKTTDYPKSPLFMRIEDIVNKDDSQTFSAVNIEDGCCLAISYSTRVFIVDGTFVEGR